jgi:hypothetical protein
MPMDDNTGGVAVAGAVMLRPIRVRCVGVCFSTGLRCVHTVVHDRCVLSSNVRKLRLAPEWGGGGG